MSCPAPITAVPKELPKEEPQQGLPVHYRVSLKTSSRPWRHVAAEAKK